MDKPRSELFGDVIRHLDAAAGETAKTGPEHVAEYITDVLIPFMEGEQLGAAVGEFGLPPVR